MMREVSLRGEQRWFLSLARFAPLLIPVVRASQRYVSLLVSC
jgi:hypothetical protein